jgi:hypothetical protein
MGCRNCGAPLPDEAALGACPSCGTLYGERAEIDEWARAVVAGRPEVERPKFLATPRLKVEFEPEISDGHRRAGPSARLTIVFRYFGAMALLSLLLGSLALAGLVYVWVLGIRARSWVIPPLVTLPVGFYAWARITSVFDRLLIRAAEGQLFCQQNRFWPHIESKVAIDDIAQLFAAQTGGAYSVLARLKDGKSKLLVRNMANPRFAVYLERQVEHALGIEDRPEEKELPKDAVLPRSVSRKKMLAIEVVLLAVFVLAPIVGLSACGTSLFELEVGDTPTEASFDLKQHRSVTFTSDIDLSEAKWRYREDIPRVVTFEIHLLRDGVELQTLYCDPFDVFAWTTTSSNKRLSSFWGPMHGCSAELDAGHYTLRAVRNWKAGAPRIGLDGAVLGARAE